MFRRGKRGQITVFVLLAIVIMLAFMFLLFMKVYVEKSRYQVLATKQVQEYISQNSMNIYVTTCLESVTTEAIIKASLQGGVLNFSGMTEGTDYVNHFVPEYNMTVKVPITIIPNQNCSVVYQSSPYYPFPETQLYPTYNLINMYNGDACRYNGDIYTYYSSFFGRNQILRLCNWNGTNKWNVTGSAIGWLTCERETYNDETLNISIQQDMEKYIVEEMSRCVDFNEVLKLSPSNITQSGPPNAYVTFGEKGFNVRLEYPFLLSIRGREPIKAFYDFAIDKSIPYKELYDYSYFSSKRDVQEAGFKMIEDRATPPYLNTRYYNYIINRTKSFDTRQMDLIKIVDNATQIDGKPMIFQFVIKNRRPALEYIHQISAFPEVDILVAENDTVEISPNGFDPDDDELVYNYSLWKEDYDEIFNASGPCLSPPNITYVKEKCMIKDNSSKPKNFTNSTRFRLTGKDATYTTNRNDKGYHELKVYVQEESRERLDDYQLIKIFVFDAPQANITTNNFYLDIANNIASIEDPFVLNGSGSVIGLSGVLTGNNFSKFMWNDTRGEVNKEVILTSDRNKTLFLPIDMNGTGSDNITRIKPFIFAQTGSRNISLTVFTFQDMIDVATTTINVTYCLPHRSNIYAFPYNTSSTSGYFANHTCCNNATYGYYGTGSVCYSISQYGLNKTFFNFWTRQPSPPPLPQNITYQNLPTTAYEMQNDIFNRTFRRFCDNKRGNMCNGTAVETRRVLYQCDDTNNNAPMIFRDERCAGPPAAFINYYTTTPFSCFNYTPGNTFESLSGQAGADGICTTSPQCANPTAAAPFATGTTDKRYTCGGHCFGGSCSRAAYSSCECDASCGGSGSAACNGLDYYPLPAGRGNPTDSVMHCEAGSPLYQDSCFNCGLTDALPRVCRIAGDGRSGCSAPSAQCDGQNANSAIGFNNNEGCTLQCVYLYCNPYAYGTTAGGGACMTSCTDNSHCANGYTCQANVCTQIILP